MQCVLQDFAQVNKGQLFPHIPALSKGRLHLNDKINKSVVPDKPEQSSHANWDNTLVICIKPHLSRAWLVWRTMWNTMHG